MEVLVNTFTWLFFLSARGDCKTCSGSGRAGSDIEIVWIFSLVCGCRTGFNVANTQRS